MNQPRTTRRQVAQRRHFALHPLSLALMLGFTGTAGALPNAGTVVSGQVTIQNPSANLQVVTQTSQRGIIDWKSFSIGSGQTVKFNQPSSSAVLLNRVTGYDPSNILGQMQANGRVFLLNPNGIVFGASARVDVGGMVASTLSLSNADFNAGRYQLGSGAGEARGAVRNDGVITARDGGTVALVAPKVTNAGTIEATSGRVGLAAADSVLVDVEGDGLLFFNASATGMKNRLEHLGRIQADGGTVEMRAAARASMVDTVLNLDGIVQARSLGVREGQVVIDGGARGITSVHGAIDASGRDAGETGGTVKVLGQLVGLFGQASVDAAGAAGGGTVLVGGNYQGKGPERNALRTFVSGGATIDVSATGNGDGGTAVVWADDVTRYHGKVTARGGSAGGDGGMVEVSGKHTLVFRGGADLTAPRGKGGTLLLDPQDIIIDTTGQTDLVGTTGDDAVATTYAFAEDTGENITLNATSLNGIGGASTITLQAERDVIFNTGITFTTANKGLVIQARNDINLGANSIITNGGAITLAANVDNVGGGSILGSGVLNATATAGAAAAGGVITVTTQGTGSISLGSVTSQGRTNATAGGVGGAGGNVTITSGSGGVNITGSIDTTGGTGGATSTATAGGVGGKGGDVSINGGGGAIVLGADLTATGGVGGAASTSDGGAGGAGGQVTLTTAGNVSIAGTVNARGGQGGNAGSGGGDNKGGGGAAAAISVTSTAGSVSVATVTAQGGDPAATGNNAGTGPGAGANITLSAGTDLTVSGQVTSSTIGAGNRTVRFEFGQGGVGSNTFTLGGAAIDADVIQAVGGAGTDRLSLARNTNITLGATSLSYTNQGLGGGVPISLPGTSIETVALRGGNGNHTINVSAWLRDAEITMSLGTDSVVGTDAAASAGARTTLIGLTGTATTFTIDGDNTGTLTAGGGTTNFSDVGRFAGSAVGGNTFVIANGGAILGGGSVTGAVTGNDTLNLSGQSGAVAILLGAPSSVTGLVPAFSQIGTVVGNGTQTTLTGLASGQTFTINAANAGTVGTLNFGGVANLVGGAGDDVFNLTTSGPNSGSLKSIVGGGGSNTLSYAGYTAGPVTYNVNTSVGTGVTDATTGIAVLTGNGSNTTLQSNATGTVFTLTGENAGTAGSPVTLTFTQVNRLAGGSGADSYIGSGGRLTGSIADAGGISTLSGTLDTDGAQSYTGAVVLAANTTLISGVTGSNPGVTFGGTVNGLFSLDVQTAGITTFTGNVGGTDALTTLTTDAGGTTVLPGTVRTSGTQAFNDAASGGTVSLQVTGAGNVTLGAGSDVDALSVSVVGASTVLVNDIDDLTISSLSLGGGSTSVTIDVAGSVSRGNSALTLGGATLVLRVGGGDNTIATVDSTVAAAFASIAATSVQVADGGPDGIHDFTVTGLGSALPTLHVTGDLSVTSAGGNINQVGALTVDGTSSFEAIGGAVNLVFGSNDFVGEVSVDVGAASAGAVVVRDTNTLLLGDITLGTGTLTLEAGLGSAGDLLQSPLTRISQADFAGAVALFAGNGGSINLTNTTNDFTGIVEVSANGASIGVADANRITVDLSAFPNFGSTGLTVIAGTDLNLFGLGAPTLSTTSGNINLQALGGPLSLGTISQLQTTTGDITLVSGATLTTSGVFTTSGALSFTALGAASDVLLTGNVTTAGSLTISAGRDVANATFLPLSVDADGGISITAAGSLALTNINLSTTNGPIALTSGTDLNVAGVSTVSGNLSFTSTGGNVFLNQPITTSGNLTIDTQGDVIGGTLSIGGNVSVDAGGNIDLFGSFGGVGPLTAGGYVYVFDQTGGLNVNGPLSAGATGYVYVYTGGVLAASTLDVTSGTSVFMQGNSGFTGPALGTVNAGTSVTLSGGNGALDLGLGSSVTASSGITLRGTGGIAADGVFDAGSGAFTAQAGTGADITVNTVTTTSNSATAVSFLNARNVTVGTINAASGTVEFGRNSGGFVLDVANVDVGSITANRVIGSATGDVDLAGGFTSIARLGPLSADGSIAILNGGGIAFDGDVSAGGTLNIAAAGLLNLGAFSASGNGTTLQAQGISSTVGSSIRGGSGDVLINGGGSAINLGGAVETASNSATALTIRNASTVSLGDVSTGATGTTTLGVAGDISGAVTLGGTALLSTGTLTASTGGSVTLLSTNLSTNVATVGAITTNGAFRLDDNVGNLAVAGVVNTNGGLVDIGTAGALTLPGSVTGAGVTLAGASVTLNGGNVNGGAGTVQLTATGGDVSQTVGTITTGGALQVSATGSATFNNPVAIGSLGASSVGGTLTLEHTGTLTVSGIVNTDSLDLTAAGAIALNAAVTASGTTTLAAGSSITQSAALNTGALVATAPGGVTLTNGANRIGTVSGSSSGGVFSIVDSEGALSLGSNVSGTSVSLSTVGALGLGSFTVDGTNGSVTLSGAGVSGTGAVTAAGAGDINVDGGGGLNAISLTGGLTATGNAVVLLNAGATTIGNVSAATLELGRTGVGNTLGSVTQAVGTSINATLLSGAVVGTATLGNANTVEQLGPFTAGALTFADVSGLNVDVVGDITTTAGTLQITTTGPLALGTSTIDSAGTLVLAGSGITQTAVGGEINAVGATTLDGGAGGVNLASDTNSFGGTVTIDRTGGAVTLHADGSLFVGSLDAVLNQPVTLVAANSLTLVTGGVLDLGNANLTLEATNGDLSISGNITANVLDITAGGDITLAGIITTTGKQTYTGTVVLGGNVTMDAGASQIDLQGGATATGGNLTLVSTSALPNAISTGDAITGIGTLTVDGNITLGGNVSGAGAQLYDGAVTLAAANVAISAGTGNVTFVSTIDGTAPGAQNLVVTTSGLTRFDDVVGTGVALGSLTTNGGGSTRLAGAGSSGTAFVTTIGNQLYDEATALGSDTLLRANQVTFSGLFNANGFEIAFQVGQETVFGGGVTGGGRIVLSAQDPGDSIGLAGAAGDLTISQASLNNLAGFGTIVIGAVDFAGDVTSNALVLPTNFEVRTTAGTVDFTSTIVSDGTARNLTVNAGGLTTFGGVVGGQLTDPVGTAIDTLTVVRNAEVATALVRSTGAQSFGGNVAVTASSTLSGSSIDIGGTLSAGALNLTLLADTIDVDAVGVATGAVRLGGSTAATTIGVAGGAGTLQISQALVNAFAGDGTLVIGRTDGTGTIATGAFTLSRDTRIESSSGNITLGGAVNSATGTNHDLEIATAGLTTIGGAIGGTRELGELTIAGASRLNGGSIATVGAQTYDGAVLLGAGTTLTGPSVEFGSAVDGAFRLTVNSGTTTFGGAVGGGTALASLTTDAAGTTTLNGNVSTTGAQTFNDAVLLGANTTLTGSSVTLAGSVNGARALQIDAAGGVTLGGSIGDTAALTSLQVNGPTSLGAAEVSTTGAQRYAGSVTLTGGATTLAGSSLTFTSTVNGAADLVLQSSGTTSFGGNVGGSTALRSIDSQGDGSVVLLGDAIRTTGAQSYAGALQLSGNTTLQGGALLFASGLSGAANLTLRTDALSAQAPLVGSGVLTIAPLSQGTTIGIAGGAGDLQITQAILNGADDFTRLVIGRTDGTGAINAGNLRLLDDTRIVSRTGDIRLNGRVDGAVDLQLDTGGTTRIAGPVGSVDALLSLTTDNNAAVADWDGTSGERTLFDAGGGRAVVTTVGNQTYNDPVVTTVPVTLSAANIVAAQTANAFGAPLNLNAQTVTLRSGQTIDLGDVTLTNGGTVETGGVLRLSGALRLEGGTLVLSSLATPTALDDFTDPELAGREFSVGLVPVREASATIEQTGTGSIATAANTLLVLRSAGGGSMNLLGDNAVLGEVSAVSGRLGDTDPTRFNGPGAVTIGFVRLNSTQINVAGAPPTNGDQSVERAGIESDAVWLRADRLFTGPDGLIRARLPFNNFQGSATSVPGITLVMSETALAEGGGFGSSSADTWIQVSVGDERGGFLTVRPKGENGPNAFILLGGNVDARPFYDGAGKITEVRVFYNGDTPRTAQESGALSAVQALAEDARQSRFEEAVRTENVRQRLRSGVIAEVGAGRPATVGRESIKLPDNCEPKGKSLECQ